MLLLNKIQTENSLKQNNYFRTGKYPQFVILVSHYPSNYPIIPSDSSVGIKGARIGNAMSEISFNQRIILKRCCSK
jgi:hypothetical protein